MWTIPFSSLLSIYKRHCIFFFTQHLIFSQNSPLCYFVILKTFTFVFLLRGTDHETSIFCQIILLWKEPSKFQLETKKTVNWADPTAESLLSPTFVFRSSNGFLYPPSKSLFSLQLHLCDTFKRKRKKTGRVCKNVSDLLTDFLPLVLCEDDFLNILLFNAVTPVLF